MFASFQVEMDTRLVRYRHVPTSVAEIHTSIVYVVKLRYRL